MSDRKQPQVPQLNLGGFTKSNGSKGVMNNIDPRRMQQYEKMQDEDDSEYDDESDGSNEDQIGLM